MSILKSIAFGAMLVALATLPAGAGDTPLYDAFQKYCVATNNDYDAITAAVERDHGVLVQATAEAGKRSAQWDIVDPLRQASDPRRALTITAVSGQTTTATLPPGTRSAVCGIMSSATTDDSLPAFLTWVGVPANKQSTEKAVTTYDFAYQQRGAVRVSLAPDGSDAAAAVKTGDTFRLILIVGRHMAVVTLVRVWLPAAKP